MLFISACSFIPPQTRQLQNNWPEDIPRQTELKTTPFFPQEKYQCGPSALATVLQYIGLTVTPADLKPLIYVPDKKGSFQHEVLAASRKFNMLAVKLEPKLTDLFKEVAAGHPVLVFQNLGLDFWKKWHFAVVVGYDADKQEIVLRSGTEKRHKNSFKTFEYTWRRGQHWALVVVPPNQIPATATPLSYIAAASGLEAIGKKSVARIAYKKAEEKWPDTALIKFGLGNIDYTLKDYDAAESAFRSALALNPENIHIWNNLAYALTSKGCYERAKQALDCALRLEPDDQSLLQSKNEIGLMQGGTPRLCMKLDCPVEIPVRK